MPLSLKALTFNVFHDYPFYRHLDRRLAILAEGLAAEAPDIAVLQEVSVSALHGNLAERLAAMLRQRGLRYEIFYAPANGSVADGGSFEEGGAILSRWPIAGAEARRLAPEHHFRREYRGYSYVEYRIGLRATVVPNPGIALDVFGAHLTDAAPGEEPPSARELQIRDLLRFVDERPSRDTPAIVAGDFNACPETRDVGLLKRAGFRDLCEGFDPGPTNDANDRDLESPRDSANQRIDYIFAQDAEQLAVRVHATRLFLGLPVEIEPGRFLWASDHSGIVAELSIGRP